MQPQLASTSSRPSVGTLSRFSSYWKPGKEGQIGSFSSRKGRYSVSGTGSIYEASEVHDSDEDLREIIEKQDRESDRLENVRACCDGKFLVLTNLDILTWIQVNTMLAISTTIQPKDVTPTFPLQAPHLDLARKDLHSNVIKAGTVYSDAQSRFSFHTTLPTTGSLYECYVSPLILQMIPRSTESE
jgi:hypothetical protein